MPLTLTERERLVVLDKWFKEFHEYIRGRRTGMVMMNDFPMLLKIYDQSRPILDSIENSGELEVSIFVSVKDKDCALVAEHELTICGVSVPCELTLIDERQ